MNTEEISDINHIEQQDKNEYYKVEDIGNSIFRKATSDTKTAFLLGNAIIAEAYNEKEKKRLEVSLAKMDTKLLVPLIAAVINIMKIEENLKN